MNFTYFFKNKKSVDEIHDFGKYDFLFSFYSKVDRVKLILEKLDRNKTILFAEDESIDILIDGSYQIEKVPCGSKASLFFVQNSNDFIAKDIVSKKICIDATGFPTPYLLCFLRMLYSRGVKEIDIFYSEPQKYKESEHTLFTDEFDCVRTVDGMGGIHTSEGSSESKKDLMIIAAGYDHERLMDVANFQKQAKKVILLGFPSLSPIMFQENIIRAKEAESDLGQECFNNMDDNIYAPAYDPFATAQALSDYLKNNGGRFNNIYFAPLSSKPQTLGFALYYMYEKGWEKNMSIIYPMCKKYISDNSTGISKVWCYKFEFPEKKG